MIGLKTIVRKAFNLFVDDVLMTMAVLLWLIMVWLLLPWIFVPATWWGVIEFLGLAVILTVSVLHHARPR